jgi:MFS family permease
MSEPEPRERARGQVRGGYGAQSGAQPDGIRPAQAREPRASAIVAVAALIAVGFMGSVIVTPLYSLYQRKFGFSEITLTLIFAVYVVGNVTALLLFGQISDQVGRKRVALPALALAAVSALLFLVADGIAWLFAGRLLLGLAVGILSGTGTAWLVELFGEQRRPRATSTATAANFAGIALGPLLGGALAEYAWSPLKLPFIVYEGLLLAVAIAVASLPEPRQERIASLRELRLQLRIGVPRDRLGAFVTPAVTAFVIFALGGLYFALIPGLLIHDLHEPNVVLAGLVTFELALIGAASIVLSRRVRPDTAMVAGLLVLLPGVALVVSAQAARSLALLGVATMLAGIAWGLAYRGSLEVVNEIAPDDHRAEAVSTFFIACFAGNSVPVIGIGVLSTLTTPLTASITFAATVACFSAAALLWHGAGGQPGRLSGRDPGVRTA